MSFNGTLIGSPTFVAGPTGFGQVLSLNGSNQYASIAAAMFLPAGGTTWTIRARFKTSSSSGVQVIFGNPDVGFIGLNGGVPFANPTGTGYTGISGSSVAADGAWHELELNVGATSATLYLDGVSIGTQSGTYSPTSAGGIWEIGAYSSGQQYYFSGQIDECAAFSTRQHAANYTPATTPISNAAANLASIYHLDGDALNDAGIAYSKSRITSGGTDILVLAPNGYDGNTATGAVFYYMGHGEDREAWLTDSLKFGIRDQLIADGRILVGISAGAASWGNDAALAKYATAHAYLLANYNVSGVVIMPQSMGGLTGFRVPHDATTFPLVKGVYAIYPCCSATAEYDDNSGFQSEILSAWGAATRSDLTTATMGKQPVSLSASGFGNIRYRFHASAGDTVVLKSHNTDAMRTLLGGATTRENSLVTTTGDHGDPSNFDPADASAFVTAALADVSTPVITSPATGFGFATASTFNF